MTNYQIKSISLDKLFLKISVLFLSAVFFISCGKTQNKSESENSGNQKTEENKTAANENSGTKSDDPLAIKGEVIEISVPTVQCSMCKKNIQNALKKIDGIHTVNIDVKLKKCLVDFDKSKTDLSKIEGAIVAAGYQANDKPADKNAYDKLDDCCKVGGH